MARVVVLGAGVAGHTAAAFARKWLGRNDSVTVVSPKDHYNWIPSNIWVGVGLMRPSRSPSLFVPSISAPASSSSTARRVSSIPRATAPTRPHL